MSITAGRHMPKRWKPELGTSHYLLRSVPKDIVARAKAKCAAQSPPISLRYAIIELMYRYGKDWPLPTDPLPGAPARAEELPDLSQSF